MTDIPLSRSTTAHSAKESPLLPPGVNQKLGERFAGLQKGIGAFGFGKQATGAGVKISRPMEALPSESNLIWVGEDREREEESGLIYQDMGTEFGAKERKRRKRRKRGRRGTAWRYTQFSNDTQLRDTHLIGCPSSKIPTSRSMHVCHPSETYRGSCVASEVPGLSTERCRMHSHLK
jgi:hypothetical protein